MGGTPRATRARYGGIAPMPKICAPNTRRANEGMARPMLETLMATTLPRPRWPRIRPIGNPITTEVTTAATDMTTCSVRRLGMPFGPCQWALAVSQTATWCRKSIGLHHPDPAAGPRGDQLLDAEEYDVDHGGHQHRQHGADDQRGVELPLQAVDDQLAVAALADQRGDGHEPDSRDGGDANPGDDGGYRQRDLDADELPAGGEAHAPGRLPDVV